MTTLPDTLSAADTAPTDTAHPERRIRSFVLRTGRMGTGQERALAELGPRYMLPYAPELLDLNALKRIALSADFIRASSPNSLENSPNNSPSYSPNNCPAVLEIGFGMGDATAKIAQALPDTFFIACEVHTPGVGALLRLIGEQKA
jgi:tRNA (guanine-N7-)-methyltransferase